MVIFPSGNHFSMNEAFPPRYVLIVICTVVMQSDICDLCSISSTG